MSNNLGDFTFGITITLNPGGVTTGATATELKFATAIDYCVDGKLYNKASGDFSLTGATAALGTAEACVLGVWLGTATAATSVQVNQGDIVSTTDLTNGTVILPLPPVVQGKALAALVRVSTNSAQTFTPGTTAPTAVTCTYNDTVMMPSQGFTAVS